LLRTGSKSEFIEARLPQVEVRKGSICDAASLPGALADITHVIHCAGATKALRNSEFYEVNQAGTRNLVDAINATPGGVRRFVHVSSMASAGPGTAARPRRETDPPQPVSEYGRSKLAAELEVRKLAGVEHVILRPPAVYGPRDREFLRLFKALRLRLLPTMDGGQALSLIFVRDLAKCLVASLEDPAAAGKTYFVAGREVVTAEQLGREIASQMWVHPVPVPLPPAVLWSICLAQEAAARLTGKAGVLSLQKFAELRAPGWVCCAALFERETGCACGTSLKEGVAETLNWYRENHWL
jgi:nucleoside-diphosphate-sugar epimerase